MTPRTSRLLVAALATTLTAGTLGCGLISKAKNLANAASVLSDFSDRLNKAATLTYTAKYKTTDGDQVTLTQQPPNAAFVGKSGRFIFTSDFMYLCGTDQGTLTCQKSPNQASSIGAADTAFIAGAAGPGFVTPEIALGLILAAGLVPGAKVDRSEKTIAGEHALCATASNLDAAASPGDTSAPKDFTVCVTDAGVLASFSGTGTDGQKASIEMTSYSSTVDPTAFTPPADATIVDVTQLDPSK